MRDYVFEMRVIYTKNLCTYQENEMNEFEFLLQLNQKKREKHKWLKFVKNVRQKGFLKQEALNHQRLGKEISHQYPTQRIQKRDHNNVLKGQ